MRPRRSGNSAALLALLLLGTLCAPAQAALQASLDRYRIAMGDTVRLTLSGDDESDPSDADLSGLRQYFDILQSSSSVSTSIINGKRSQNRELILEITPRQQGSVVIPPFEVDGRKSEALSVEIGPAPTMAADDEFVIFEVEVDRQEVYVQGQLLLTFRVQQAVNLESRSITELAIDNAYVESLGQNSFQRTIDGQPWLVHEIRYAVFPEASGTLTIPAQTFSGRLGSGRRTLFDTRPAGRLLRRQSEALSIAVLPRPDNYPDSTWLPAAQLRVEEQWSSPVDQLKIGDSVTRTITVTGDGLQGAQLPPLDSGDMGGLRAYPDQPVINNVSGEKGVTGIRTDSLALVAVSAGEYELPAVEIPWWDTQSNQLRVARLPAKRLRVQPPASSAPPDERGGAAMPAAQSYGVPVSTAGYWPWIALTCALGWLLTSLLWWRRSRSHAAPSGGGAGEAPASGRTSALLKACSGNDARRAKQELRAWLRERWHAAGVDVALESRAQDALSGEFADAVAELDRCLYGSTADGAVPWNGERLASAIRALPAPATGPRDPERGHGLPPLYLGQ